MNTDEKKIVDLEIPEEVVAEPTVAESKGDE